MTLLILAIACGGDNASPADFSLEFCQAISDCGLNDPFGYAEPNDCVSIEEEKFSVYDLNDEYAVECVEQTRLMTCSDLVEQSLPDSCLMWFGESEG